MEQLQRHCRVCGGRLNKAKGKVQPVYSCIDHSEDLQTIVGVYPHSEDKSTFPSNFCNQCRVRLVRAKKAREDSLPFQSIVPMEWCPHEENCKVRNDNRIIITNYNKTKTKMIIKLSKTHLATGNSLSIECFTHCISVK